MPEVNLFNTRIKINLTSFNVLQRAGINTIEDLKENIKTKEDLKKLRNLWKDDIEKIWRYLKRNQ